MNEETKKYEMVGDVLDVGGGTTANYHFMQRDSEARVQVIDLKSNTTNPIDFEVDTLPYAADTYDQVLMYNILEHIYHSDHLLREVHRVLRVEGDLFGFVPFLVQYHPDPHDYYRYTGEALEKKLQDIGFNNVAVTVVGGGVFTAGYNILAPSLPRFLRCFAYLPCHALDWLYLKFRPAAGQRYPLGYYFFATQ